MYALKDMGTKLVIDDFGTGYSSLSYLKQFPVDKLKIDRSFIKDMVSNQNDAAIAKAIINLGHSLNLQVLAEGIEFEYQRDFILQHGCDFAQGYYFKGPESPDNIIQYLKDNWSKTKLKSNTPLCKPPNSGTFLAVYLMNLAARVTLILLLLFGRSHASDR